eukprot:GDKH01020190.1.p2 GENE.GDKH01020190.1~~GDKH01020190.1.p2  ORF type:complete len:180 (+),score=25.64 GDKH01020190.1:96-635(+)
MAHLLARRWGLSLPLTALRRPALRQGASLGRCFGSAGPRDHLHPDGEMKADWLWSTNEHFHWPDASRDAPPKKFKEENGQKYITNTEYPPVGETTLCDQANIGFFPHQRMQLWANYSMVLKVEFCFFYIPTLIIAALAIPVLCGIYLIDEVVYTTMTVKVVGRQWYWVYEVESPTDDDE